MTLTLDQYQDRARLTALYRQKCAEQGIPNYVYSGMGLGNEAGEVTGKLKKAIRDDGGEITPERRGAILAELGDVLWYVALLADDLGIPLSEIAGANLSKLESRADRGTLQGSGDGR